MEIKRDLYLKKIVSYMWDGQVKVITGIRRCGKSYLLRNIFKKYLLEQGVAEDHILTYELDLAKDIRYRNPLELAKTVRELVEGRAEQFYLFVDEIPPDSPIKKSIPAIASNLINFENAPIFKFLDFQRFNLASYPVHYDPA